MLSLMDTIVSLVVKVLWKLISLICFRVYLEVNVHKNPTCFSRWSVRRVSNDTIYYFDIYGDSSTYYDLEAVLAEEKE